MQREKVLRSYLKTTIPKIDSRKIDEAIKEYSSRTKRKSPYSALQAYFMVERPKPLFPAEIVIGVNEPKLYYVFGRIGLEQFRWSDEKFKSRRRLGAEEHYLVADHSYSTANPHTISFGAIDRFERLFPSAKSY